MPQPEAKLDPLQVQTMYIRNRDLIFMLSFLCILHVLRLIFGSSDDAHCALRDLVWTIVELGFTTLIARRHPLLIGYAIELLLVFATIVSPVDPKEISYWLFCPIFILFVTSSKWLCLFDGLFRLAYMAV